MQPELIADYQCVTGEGPLWHPMESRLYWADIPEGRLFRYNPYTRVHEQIYEGRENRRLHHPGRRLPPAVHGQMLRRYPARRSLGLHHRRTPSRNRHPLQRRHSRPRRPRLLRRHAPSRRTPRHPLPHGHRLGLSVWFSKTSDCATAWVSPPTSRACTSPTPSRTRYTSSTTTSKAAR